jgi:hypothetical protein
VSVVIFTGLSRYQDPWHPVAETSAEIAGVVRALGLEPEMRTDESPDALAKLSGVDLLIVNSGGGDPDAPIAYDPAWQAVFEADPSAVTHPVFDHLAPISGVTERPAVVCYDERYWRMPVRDGNTPLLGHETRGDWYVMGWSRGGSVVFDGLGHDRRSYASVQRRRYLANEIRWLLRDRVALTGNEGAL